MAGFFLVAFFLAGFFLVAVFLAGFFFGAFFLVAFFFFGAAFFFGVQHTDVAACSRL